jgi:protease IV
MNPSDDFAPTTPPPVPPPSPPPAPPPPSVSAAAPVAPPRPAFEATLETVARALLQDRRSERRWRVFFRLAWLGIVLALLWGLLVARNHVTAPGVPHTALVEVRGEISPDSEASPAAAQCRPASSTTRSSA